MHDIDAERARQLIATFSRPRMARYLALADGDPAYAVRLYDWNARIAGELFHLLHIWEVALRNRVAGVFSDIYGADWAFSGRFDRDLKSRHRAILRSVISRTGRTDAAGRPTRSHNVVVELTAGIWVAFLREEYEVPFRWRFNLKRVFAHAPERQFADLRAACERLVELRNRLAHHEPVYAQLPLVLEQRIEPVIKAICPAALTYARSASGLAALVDEGPPLNPP